MQPCSREMQGMGSITACLSPSQIALQELQNSQQRQQQQQIQNPSQVQVQGSHYDHSSNDDFLDQMLSNLPSWSELPGNPKSPWDLNPSNPNSTSNNSSHKLFNIPIGSSSNKARDLSEDQAPSQTENLHYPFDESALLASRLRQHQISGNSPGAKSLMFQQQLLLSRAVGTAMARSPSATSASGSLAGDSGLLPLPLSLGSGDSSRDDVADTSFKSSNQGGEGVQGLYNGFAGSLSRTAQTENQQHFHHPQTGSISTQNYGAPATGINQPSATGSTGGNGAPARQRVRARRGQATDPHSIAERVSKAKLPLLFFLFTCFSFLRRERIAERMKALQELVPNANKVLLLLLFFSLQDSQPSTRHVLSMSRLGGAAAVAPLVADISSEGGGDCIQASGSGLGRGSNGTQAASSNDTLTVTEHQVAKLMEEDMGSAMQYLQGKGLCLMPISLATAISTTCHSRNPHPLLASNADGPPSPSMSVLTVQSATMGNGGGDASVKDATSVSKP
ncbi:hypothetical protein HHK36_006371 [Tetracentron sinense]|uniref:Transcription factor bHLH66 n=1 Tax=Tetracentron sinense TaxID=13715 RepID=A0A834ZHC3_TETSI|nr:hypothetical protein HHK36_006371 [Tetracentron sinense]